MVRILLELVLIKMRPSIVQQSLIFPSLFFSLAFHSSNALRLVRSSFMYRDWVWGTSCLDFFLRVDFALNIRLRSRYVANLTRTGIGFPASRGPTLWTLSMLETSTGGSNFSSLLKVLRVTPQTSSYSVSMIPDIRRLLRREYC